MNSNVLRYSNPGGVDSSPFFSSITRIKNIQSKVGLLALLVTLGACSNGSGGGSSSNLDNNNEFISVEPSFSVVDTENVESAQLSVVKGDALEGAGLTSVFYNTELDCETGWQTTTFDFNQNDSTIKAELCDGTMLSASYENLSNAIQLSNITLDGVEVESGVYEYWGFLPVNENSNQWKACYFSFSDNIDGLIDGQTTVKENKFAPSPGQFSFDCSEDVFLFYSAELADKFREEIGAI